ncbi:restriction endonuclease subunit S [Runella zeae]|uniref:restriction endonuclease subunit S n=1 Tax=Runella zeae TaxID=94255 RepID=UPI0004229FE1|nr:restriction endonuclease subunit S [Runella zeae]
MGTWDAAIQTTTTLLAALQKRKKGLMQQLLTPKPDWKEVRLGECFSERNETGFNHLPLLAITSSNGVVPRESIEKRDTSNEDKSKYLRICKGDIGYNTMRMWQGVSGVSQYEGIVSPAYTILIPRQEINVSYLFKFSPMIHLFWRYSQGLVDDTLNCKYDSFRRIKINLPSLAEQIHIAAILNTADAELRQTEAYLEKLKTQKRGLMQQLLTGKVRVTTT